MDYAQLVKLYGAAPEGSTRRYSPAECTGAKKVRVEGNPDPKHVSTSYAERSNLTVRMHMRRFTRLTNAFSKKVENHAYAVALHMMYYNFVRIQSEAADDAGDGGGRHRSALGDRRHCSSGRECRGASKKSVGLIRSAN